MLPFNVTCLIFVLGAQSFEVNYRSHPHAANDQENVSLLASRLGLVSHLFADTISKAVVCYLRAVLFVF